MDILEDNENFTLGEGVNGPLLAAAVGIELILTIIVNLFVLIFTLYHPKTLKQPSIIFLTNFVLINLLLAVFVMPSTVITAAYGEWVFGKTPEEKNGTCQFFGFVFANAVQLTILTLTMISIDRFLFIVKPLVHRRFMKTSVAAAIFIIVWILSCVLNTPPYFGLGQYTFLTSVGTCGFLWVGQRDYTVYFCVLTSIDIVIILVTTLWTFFFSRKFVHGILWQHSTIEDNTQRHNQVYMRKMKKLIGVFGMLLTVLILTIAPCIITAMIVAIVSDKLPLSVYSVIYVMFLLNCVLNPIVQCYFRRDVSEFIVHYYKMAKCICRQKSENKTTINSTHI